LHVGLRRRSYGGKRNPDSAWWVQRARDYAAEFPGAEPTIIEIVSVYLDNGTTQFEFAKPDGYAGSTRNMTFKSGATAHEEALSLYDGMPVTDAEARSLVEALQALNPAYTLFLKHYSAKHMPPTYRHPNLYFVSDSQQFGSFDEMMADFRQWAGRFDGAVTGCQFGYPDDRKWWLKMSNPPLDVGSRIRAEIPSCQYLFWVDFTADRVQFN
jgi:hypothetical protein